ncbi:hypothetical protein DMP23_43475 [Amycolatopsis sp. A1MSW2902]|uniref:phosphosulfolactate synthase n=1 Tax=Amycolatopsis sp. A1MSW2902 TaxID=687413 RepID=UPI00307D748D
MTSAARPAFSGVGVPDRPRKPRDRGLTVTVDFGLGTAAQQDLLEIAGDAMDHAKLVVGVAGLIPLSLLRRKNELYRDYGVEPFPGGMFLEYAIAHDRAESYLDGAAEAGYRLIEVSDNAIPIDQDVKESAVAAALRRGLAVFGEVGSKHVRTPAAELVDGVRGLLSAGCRKVLVEAAELLDGDALRTELLDALSDAVPIDDLVFELPGPWLPDVHHHQVHALQSTLIRLFGPDVNIANDPAGNALFLEAMRRGIGPNTLDEGARA